MSRFPETLALGAALIALAACPALADGYGLGRLATDDEVKAALDSLPENFRLAVYLADVEGFAYKEIADITEVPIGTVMSRLHRGRKALHKSLYDHAVARGIAEAGTST